MKYLSVILFICFRSQLIGQSFPQVYCVEFTYNYEIQSRTQELRTIFETVLASPDFELTLLQRDNDKLIEIEMERNYQEDNDITLNKLQGSLQELGADYVIFGNLQAPSLDSDSYTLYISINNIFTTQQIAFPIYIPFKDIRNDRICQELMFNELFKNLGKDRLKTNRNAKNHYSDSMGEKIKKKIVLYYSGDGFVGNAKLTLFWDEDYLGEGNFKDGFKIELSDKSGVHLLKIKTYLKTYKFKIDIESENDYYIKFKYDRVWGKLRLDEIRHSK